ncbi:DUF1080 domain-containing protein [Chitinophaga pendula]|uniref:3-keto-disaccharide hydrolase n=1 Tax=Chitinophaga TaxID=79328 RepID=UPI000BAF8834|nr:MULTISPECIES: DUF1080 domain-containing protein [Chitinophaga]ASZ10664.1 hypothetical protein CK934_06560 [Chitinophaga sp. MD30]UCJ06360.1 DUF1080 domain-containing protein [Chitinophaga pendula]
MKKLIIPALSVMTMAVAACGGGAGTETGKDSAAVTVDTAGTVVPTDTSAANTLTDAEKAEGWKLLFNGQNLDGWRMYKNKPSNSWTVDNGTLHCLGSETDKSDKRGDLITTDEYENFEFATDWKIAPKGNSGILYMVNEEYDASYLSGPEYQLIDDENFPEKLENWQKTGANYAMDPPLKLAAKPVGEWNHTRIIVNKGHVEHWLNGEKVAEYDMNSDAWKKHKQEGKWKDAKGYGAKQKGHICVQDHGSEIWFKNVKLKQL